MEGHKKKVTDVMFHPTENIAFSCSSDRTAIVWNLKEAKPSNVVKNHTEEVTGCTLHATGLYWVTGSLDNSWAFHDIPTATCLSQISAEAGVSAVSFHPDGLILGTGLVDSTIKIWDAKTQKKAATFEGHKGKITDLSFSENGYYLATSAEDNTVKLWDLRKLKNIQTVDTGSSVSSVDFDYTGTYLAVACGNDIRLYMGKNLTQLTSLSQHTQATTDVKWGTDAQLLVSTSMDRNIKFWGKKGKK